MAQHLTRDRVGAVRYLTPCSVLTDTWDMDDTHIVTCPYCSEEIEIYVEPDVRGTYVQDCEVCCNPWTVRVTRDGEDLYVEVGRADGSE
jgi:hypothetical protein